MPNSGSYELCYPGRRNTIVANTVHDNNYLDGPGIDVSLLAQGNGILVAGSVDNTIERNLVFDHDRGGIVMVPFPEEDAADTLPPREEWDRPCSENRERELPAESAGLVLWNATDNRVVGNVVTGSGMADIASATIPDPEAGVTIESLDNCFEENEVSSSAPENLQELAPCQGEGSGGDFAQGSLDLASLIADQPDAPPEDAYKSTPVPGDQENMPDARRAPAERFEGPATPDVESLTVPEKPRARERTATGNPDRRGAHGSAGRSGACRLRDRRRRGW
ncbi:MAG: hypothetical protein U5R31_17285 [Acidimicrobiia bacterium]|nr:hypothetical protein [Acidimicrobiia bacterium]